MVQLLDESQIQQRMNELSDEWQRAGNKIQCTRELGNFVEAVNFVNKLVEPAESAGHHPDLAVSYNKVTIELTSHGVGGLTDNDFNMAKTISNIQ